MRKLISCSIGYHQGGLGQHFSHIVEEARRAGELSGYITPRIKPGDEAMGLVMTQKMAPWLMKWTPVRWSPGWRWHFDCDLWDRKVAAALKEPMEAFAAFGGQALHSFRKARKLGAKRLELIAANSHVNNCVRLHAQATTKHPIEKSWLNEAQRKKTVEEYSMADIIWIASDYSMEVFEREGVAKSKLRRVYYPTDPRFVPDPGSKPDDGVFRIVYLGALTVAKGVPLLLEAFERFKDRPAELTLVGGTSTRPMRRYMDERQRRDPRVKIAPGDPLPHLHRADVCVHPSWEDNWAYACAEAIACGVPLILTADTGAKELIREGENGWVVPTGDSDAILNRLREAAGVN